METLSRKKVLFLITKSNWGGAQRYIYDIATHLTPEQFEPVVALGGAGALKDLLVEAGIRVIPIQALTRDISLTQEWALGKELWHIFKTEKPDILHVNSSKAGGAGTFIGRLVGIPHIIFTAHGWAFNEDRPWWQRFIIKSLHWMTVLLSHHTIAVSYAIISELNWPLAQRKMTVIHPGRSIEQFVPREDARSRIALHHPSLSPYAKDFWVITIAELHPIKRLHILIEAFALHVQQYPQTRLIIIGEGSKYNELLKQIIDTHLTEHVFLIGHITEASHLLKAGDLFVLPSKSESYGYVLHEAGLACLPVIATNVGGIPDIIKHKQSGLLIEPDNVQALVSALTTLREDPDLARTYAETLKSNMYKRSITAMVETTEAVYHTLA